MVQPESRHLRSVPCACHPPRLLPKPPPLLATSRITPSRLAGWLRALQPEPVVADWRERLRVTIGAALGIWLTAWICSTAGASYAAAWPWLVAPLGASAVLVFGVPASPLAQPWAVVGGNTLSALVGIACVRWLGGTELAAALAVGLAIGLMFALRCLHPPGGASALLVVLTGVADPQFALYPVLANSVLLVAAGMAYNHATGRSYPHLQAPRATAVARDDDANTVDADIDAVLARYNQVLAISRDELKALLEDTQMRGYQRKLANLRCSDIMSPDPVTVSPRMTLQQAWPLFRIHHIKALPVVDVNGRIVGIVTPSDFVRAAEVAGSDVFDLRLRKPSDWPDQASTAAHSVVGQIMTRRVRVASINRHLAELIPLFAGTGHHHIPIVDGGGHLVGIVTQSDVVAALSGPEVGRLAAERT